MPQFSACTNTKSYALFADFRCITASVTIVDSGSHDVGYLTTFDEGNVVRAGQNTHHIWYFVLS